MLHATVNMKHAMCVQSDLADAELIPAGMREQSWGGETAVRKKIKQIPTTLFDGSRIFGQRGKALAKFRETGNPV